MNSEMSSNGGESSLSMIAELKCRLKASEANEACAVQERNEMVLKLEEKIQEIHEIKKKLQLSTMMQNSMKEEHQNVKEDHAKQQSEIKKNHRTELQQLLKDLNECRRNNENLEVQLIKKEEDTNMLISQLNEAKKQFDSHASRLNDSLEESAQCLETDLQSQLTVITNAKQRLEKQLAEQSTQLHVAEVGLTRSHKAIADLQKELEEKECQCTSYYNMLEKEKEDKAELQLEIESFHLAETDPHKKGNSLFGELEDRRVKVEEQFKLLKTNYDAARKELQKKNQQLANMRVRLRNALTQSDNVDDPEYTAQLNSSLTSSRKQLDAMMKRCQELTEENEKLIASGAQDSQFPIPCDDDGLAPFFCHMLKESELKVKKLQKENDSVRTEKVGMSNQLVEWRRKVHMMEGMHRRSMAKLAHLQAILEEHNLMPDKEIDSHNPGITEIIARKDKAMVDNAPIAHCILGSEAVADSSRNINSAAGSSYGANQITVSCATTEEPAANKTDFPTIKTSLVNDSISCIHQGCDTLGCSSKDGPPFRVPFGENVHNKDSDNKVKPDEAKLENEYVAPPSKKSRPPLTVMSSDPPLWNSDHIDCKQM